MQVPACLTAPVLPHDSYTALYLTKLDRQMDKEFGSKGPSQNFFSRIYEIYFRCIIIPIVLVVLSPILVCADLAIRIGKKILPCFSKTTQTVHCLAFLTFLVTLPVRILAYAFGNKRLLLSFHYPLEKENPNDLHPLIKMIKDSPQEAKKVIPSLTKNEAALARTSMTTQEEIIFKIARVPGACDFLQADSPNGMPRVTERVLKFIEPHINPRDFTSLAIKISIAFPTVLLPENHNGRLFVSRIGLRIFPTKYLKAYKSFEFPPPIYFKGELAEDAGGPHREFLSFLFYYLFQEEPAPCPKIRSGLTREQREEKEEEIRSIAHIIGHILRSRSPALIDTDFRPEFHTLLWNLLKKDPGELATLYYMDIQPILEGASYEGEKMTVLLMRPDFQNIYKNHLLLFAPDPLRPFLELPKRNPGRNIVNFLRSSAGDLFENCSYFDLIKEYLFPPLASAILMAHYLRSNIRINLEQIAPSEARFRERIHGQALTGNALRNHILEKVLITEAYQELFTRWIHQKNDEDLNGLIKTLTGSSRLREQDTCYIFVDSSPIPVDSSPTDDNIRIRESSSSSCGHSLRLYPLVRMGTGAARNQEDALRQLLDDACTPVQSYNRT